MNRGILFATAAALTFGSWGLGCKPAPGPGHLKSVDSLLTTVEAALLTLNELDRERYTRATAVYRSQAARFQERFKDTLDRPTAELLGNHFRLLRAAESMGEEHDQVLAELIVTKDRLKALRRDMESGAMHAQDADKALATEHDAGTYLAVHVDAVIANYRAVQRAWDERDAVDSLLALTNNDPQGQRR
jgi:hypothetical protein